MTFEPWMLVALEENGYTDTAERVLNRLARYIKEHYPNGGYLSETEFRQICLACNVDLNNIHKEDVNALISRLNRN